MIHDKFEFHRESELKGQLLNILKELTGCKHEPDSIDINGLLRLKNLLSSINNLITLLATCGFVDYLENRGFINGTQADIMKKTIQSQHANTNGYDIEFTDGSVSILAEIKCNIPVNGNAFGSAQRNGILKDVRGLLLGKNRPKPKNAYKFMVILNTDSCSANTDTLGAIDRLLPKINSEYANVAYMPEDNSLLIPDTVYIVVFDL